MQFNPVAAIASKNLPVVRMAYSNPSSGVLREDERDADDCRHAHAYRNARHETQEVAKTAKREHPKASKKDIVRAAFFSIIANADDDHGKAKNLQAFGMAERVKMALDKSSPRQTR